MDELLDPKTGVLRGIMIDVEAGKGGPDRDDKIIGIRVDELKKIHATLKEAKRLLNDSRDFVMGCVGSTYCDTDKDDEKFADEIDTFLGNQQVDWRNINN